MAGSWASAQEQLTETEPRESSALQRQPLLVPRTSLEWVPWALLMPPSNTTLHSQPFHTPKPQQPSLSVTLAGQVGSVHSENRYLHLPLTVQPTSGKTLHTQAALLTQPLSACIHAFHQAMGTSLGQPHIGGPEIQFIFWTLESIIEKGLSYDRAGLHSWL